MELDNVDQLLPPNAAGHLASLKRTLASLLQKYQEVKIAQCKGKEPYLERESFKQIFVEVNETEMLQKIWFGVKIS